MTVRRITVGMLVTGAAAFLLTCSEATGPEPAALLMVSGDNQSGVVNQSLPDSLVARVNGTDGQPIKGVKVSWAVRVMARSVQA